jgi:alpha-tubulin suppressor-like RCC1 family protein
MVAIAAGGDSGYALRRDGSVWAWGDDEFGELGNGVRRFDVGSPVRVRGLHDVVAITAGACSAYALLRNGTVWAWGRGDFGQLGNGSISEERVPVRVKGLTGVVQVVGGGSTVLALERDRSPWSWGANAFGQLGNNSVVNRDLPVRVLGLPGSPRPGKTQPDARPAG